MYKYSMDKTYSYIKGYAMALHFDNTVKALAFARSKHDGCTRRNGEPYIIHPLTMTSHAIALGIAEDNLLATLLLHDVLEDCNVSVDELPVNDEVKQAVKLVTYHKPTNPDNKEIFQINYFANIEENRIASLTKIIDRCHNVSTMAGVFTPEKIDEYIKETERFIMPLIRTTKDKWPEFSDTLFILKYHIDSIVSSIKSVYYTNLKEE